VDYKVNLSQHQHPVQYQVRQGSDDLDLHLMHYLAKTGIPKTVNKARVRRLESSFNALPRLDRQTESVNRERFRSPQT